jgi:hypothetical protein
VLEADGTTAHQHEPVERSGALQTTQGIEL